MQYAGMRQDMYRIVAWLLLFYVLFAGQGNMESGAGRAGGRPLGVPVFPWERDIHAKQCHLCEQMDAKLSFDSLQTAFPAGLHSARLHALSMRMLLGSKPWS